MCLYVRESHVRNPLHRVECFKQLTFDNGRWITPYQGRRVQEGTGWFMPKDPATVKEEFSKGDRIDGGYIHAYMSMNRYDIRSAALRRLPKDPQSKRVYAFAAIALDVFATNIVDEELICNALYIPAFDKTGEHKNAILDLGTSTYRKLR